MRVGKKVKVEDQRYQNTEKSLMRRILNLLQRRSGHISVREVCTGIKARNNKQKSKAQKDEKDLCSTVTFYNHYQDINDAIEQMEAKLLQELEERLEKLAQTAKGLAPGNTELTAEQVLAETLKFIRQNKQVFIVTAECWRLGTFEGIFKLVYPYVSQGFPNYAGTAAQEQLFWIYLGQNVAIVMAWVRQTECNIEEEKKCLAKLLTVQRQMGQYLRKVGIVDYKNAKVEEADLPKSAKKLTGKHSNPNIHDSSIVPWWRK